MTKNKISFSVMKDDKQVELAVVRPTVKAQQEAQMVYAKAFADAVKGGAILKSKLDAVAREQNLWDDVKQAEFERLVGSLEQNQKVVKGLVKGTKLTDAKAAAIEMRRARAAVVRLTTDRLALESNSAEGIAENARFNHLVAACTVYDADRKAYFKNTDDYLSREDDPATVLAADRFAQLYYDHDPDGDKKLPENQFLFKHKLCNDKLHLVDEQGRLVNVDGKLVNEAGRFINEAGELVDQAGNRVDEAGNPLNQETYPFLDENGEAVGCI